MFKVFHQLASSYYTHEDIKHCLDLAVAIHDSEPDTLTTVYIANSQCIDTLAGVDGLSYNSTSFRYVDIQGLIQTERTYTPKNQPEIVLAVCMADERSLIKIQDSPSIRCVFVVPEMPNQLNHWLKVHSAYDISNGECEPFPEIPGCSMELKRSIGYLKDYTRRLGVNLEHTSIQMGVMRSVFNAFLHQGNRASRDEIYTEALRRDLSHTEAEVLSKAFSRSTAFPNSSTTVWDAINDSRWECN